MVRASRFKSGSRAFFSQMLAGAVAFVGVSLLSGCAHNSSGNASADYPEAEQFPQIYQQKLMASAHWQLIAQNEAEWMRERFENQESLNLSYQPVSIGDNTPFERAYGNFLLGSLIHEQGAMVFEDSRGMPVEYDVQVVEFDERRQAGTPPGFFSATALSAYVIAHAVDAWANPSALLIPLVVGMDGYQYFNSDTNTPDTEIIVTTRVKNDGQLVYSHSSVYYMRSEDDELYRTRRTFGVRGPVTL